MSEVPYTPPGGPPQKPINRELFKILGEERIRRMLSLFYANLSDTAIRHYFPKDPEGLEAAAQRSADFFIQIMGGPAF